MCFYMWNDISDRHLIPAWSWWVQVWVQIFIRMYRYKSDILLVAFMITDGYLLYPWTRPIDIPRRREHGALLVRGCLASILHYLNMNLVATNEKILVELCRSGPLVFATQLWWTNIQRYIKSSNIMCWTVTSRFMSLTLGWRRSWSIVALVGARSLLRLVAIWPHLVQGFNPLIQNAVWFCYHEVIFSKFRSLFCLQNFHRHWDNV
jgi:hypothetical protein